jgi:hypothetical protein
MRWLLNRESHRIAITELDLAFGSGSHAAASDTGAAALTATTSSESNIWTAGRSVQTLSSICMARCETYRAEISTHGLDERGAGGARTIMGSRCDSQAMPRHGARSASTTWGWQ